jgi:crossover junction endodeoxyribonuclease RusA
VRTFAFSVEGIPQPKGSTRAFVPKGWTRPIITAASPKTKKWEREITAVARQHITPFDTSKSAFRVRLRFVLPRPKRLGAAFSPHITRPDIDKLCRCVLDALTGVAWHDDAQVVTITATKRYVRQALMEATRVDISLVEVRDEQGRIELSRAGVSQIHTEAERAAEAKSS